MPDAKFLTPTSARISTPAIPLADAARHFGLSEAAIHQRL
jgi:hypothetical protein